MLAFGLVDRSVGDVAAKDVELSGNEAIRRSQVAHCPLVIGDGGNDDRNFPALFEVGPKGQQR